MSTLIDRELVLEHLDALTSDFEGDYYDMEKTGDELYAAATKMMAQLRLIIEGKEHAPGQRYLIEGIDIDDIEEPLDGVLHAIETLAESKDTMTRFSVLSRTASARNKIDAMDKDDLRQYTALTEDALTALLSA